VAISNLPVICLEEAIIASPISNAAESEEQAINDAYSAWVEAANEKDIAKWSKFLADDPYFVPADSPPLTGTKEVIDYYKRLFADFWFSLDCEQQKVEVTESGEMAWAHGICNATFTGPDGNKANSTSRWLKVWIKQSDGSWRGRVNEWQYTDKP
jgi:uncharacterized protein (TIGR02246 family)